jgi:hypothetical protein
MDDLDERPLADLLAANAFRETLMEKADAFDHGSPLWHGWAIFDSFLAGLDHARAQAAGTVE